MCEPCAEALRYSASAATLTDALLDASMALSPFIALTDKKWFDYLKGRAGSDHIVDEANFWSPKAQTPLAKMEPGQPVFLRLKAPHYALAGVGFYTAFHVLPMEDAWNLFEWRNGDDTCAEFYSRIRKYRRGDPSEEGLSKPLGCMVLRAVELWDESRWIPWGVEEGFSSNIVRGMGVRDPAQSARLMSLIGTVAQIRAEEFADRFQLVDADGRRWRDQSAQAVREGQGGFRLRLLDAYGNQCAITGEHTVPVLDAAHIQPYLGPASNHVQNGMLLTKEFHALFDLGYVSVTAERRVRVSSHLKRDFSNGRRYYPYDGKVLAKLPDDARLQPSPDALDWHMRNVFRAG